VNITIDSCPLPNSVYSVTLNQAVFLQVQAICQQNNIVFCAITVTTAAPNATCSQGWQTITIEVLSQSNADTIITGIRNGEAFLVNSQSNITAAFANGTLLPYIDPPPSALQTNIELIFCGECSGTQSPTNVAAQIKAFCASQPSGTCGVVPVNLTCTNAPTCNTSTTSSNRQLQQTTSPSQLFVQTFLIVTSNYATAEALSNAIRSGFFSGIPVNSSINTVVLPSIPVPVSPSTPSQSEFAIGVTECASTCSTTNCPASITSSQAFVLVSCACEQCSVSSSSERRTLQEIILSHAQAIVSVIGCTSGNIGCCKTALNDAVSAGVRFQSGSICSCPGVGTVTCPGGSSGSKKGLLGLLGLLGLIPLIVCFCLLFLCCIRRRKAANEVPFAVFDPQANQSALNPTVFATAFPPSQGMEVAPSLF